MAETERDMGFMNNYRQVCLLVVLVLVFTVSSFAQNTLNSPQGPDTLVNKRMVRWLSAGTGTLYVTSIAGLYQLWYKDYPQSSFHFFNDNAEWMQIDKAGHATTSYHLGLIGYESLALAGVDNKRAALIGGTLGLFYLTTVEVFDGFSAGWGASTGDVLANVTGAATFISQQLIWKEQRISMKWSYHPTKFAQYRPDLYGTNGIQHMLKDYNGHTYWLSFNIKSFLPEHNRFPGWLNIAAGYSGTGMLGAFDNPSMYEGTPLPEFERYRKYLVSVDIDLSRIKTRYKSVNFLLKTFSFIKIPMPAVEVNKNGIKLHPVYL